jgi:hypothetical protein
MTPVLQGNQRVGGSCGVQGNHPNAIVSLYGSDLFYPADLPGSECVSNSHLNNNFRYCVG